MVAPRVSAFRLSLLRPLASYSGPLLCHRGLLWPEIFGIDIFRPLNSAHSSNQQHTAAQSNTQHANPLAQQASSLRPTGLDSIPCVPVTRSERRRVHFSEGEPGFGGGRRAVCLALYLHVYTYVYHTCIFTYINICISHVYIYIHTHMYITHQRHPRHAYESPSRVPRRSCALSSAELLFQHAGVCIDTYRGICIGCRSFGKAFGG